MAPTWQHEDHIPPRARGNENGNIVGNLYQYPQTPMYKTQVDFLSTTIETKILTLSWARICTAQYCEFIAHGGNAGDTFSECNLVFDRYRYIVHGLEYVGSASISIRHNNIYLEQGPTENSVCEKHQLRVIPRGKAYKAPLVTIVLKDVR